MRTYKQVFGDMAIWFTRGPDVLLLGFRDPSPHFDIDRLRQRFERPDFRAGFERAQIGSWIQLLAHEVLPLGAVGASGAARSAPHGPASDPERPRGPRLLRRRPGARGAAAFGGRQPGGCERLPAPAGDRRTASRARTCWRSSPATPARWGSRSSARSCWRAGPPAIRTRREPPRRRRRFTRRTTWARRRPRSRSPPSRRWRSCIEDTR